MCCSRLFHGHGTTHMARERGFFVASGQWGPLSCVPVVVVYRYSTRASLRGPPPLPSAVVNPPGPPPGTSRAARDDRHRHHRAAAAVHDRRRPRLLLLQRLHLPMLQTRQTSASRSHAARTAAHAGGGACGPASRLLGRQLVLLEGLSDPQREPLRRARHRAQLAPRANACARCVTDAGAVGVPTRTRRHAQGCVCGRWRRQRAAERAIKC